DPPGLPRNDHRIRRERPRRVLRRTPTGFRRRRRVPPRQDGTSRWVGTSSLRCDVSGRLGVPQMSQRGEEFRATSSTSALDRAGCHIEGLCGFLDVVVEHVHVCQGELLLGGECVEGRLYVQPGFGTGGVVIGGTGAVQTLVGQHVECLPLGGGGRAYFTAAEPVVAGVDYDPVQPRGHL